MLPRGDSPRFVEAVMEVCRRHAIDVLVPTVDSELLPVAQARAEFEAAGVALVNPSADTLRMCLDKWALHQRCDGVVRVPASAVVNGDFDPASSALPVIVKPRSGSGSRGIRLISAPRRAAGRRARRNPAGAGAPARSRALARRAGASRRTRARRGSARTAQGRLGDRRHRARDRATPNSSTSGAPSPSGSGWSASATSRSSRPPAASRRCWRSTRASRGACR